MITPTKAFRHKVYKLATKHLEEIVGKYGGLCSTITKSANYLSKNDHAYVSISVQFWPEMKKIKPKKVGSLFWWSPIQDVTPRRMALKKMIELSKAKKLPKARTTTKTKPNVKRTSKKKKA